MEGGPSVEFQSVGVVDIPNVQKPVDRDIEQFSQETNEGISPPTSKEPDQNQVNGEEPNNGINDQEWQSLLAESDEKGFAPTTDENKPNDDIKTLGFIGIDDDVEIPNMETIDEDWKSLLEESDEKGFVGIDEDQNEGVLDVDVGGLTDEEIAEARVLLSENDGEVQDIEPMSDEEITEAQLLLLSDEEDNKEPNNFSSVEEVPNDYAYAMAEKLTGGLSPENPKIVDFLVSESKRVRDKYKLPDMRQLFSAPEIYDEQLGNVRLDNKIGSLTKEMVAEFFNKYPNSVAAYFPQVRSIGFNPERQQKDPQDYEGMSNYYMGYTHELTHGLQDIIDPNMSIDQKEYEANLVSIPMEILQEKGLLTKEIIEYIFKGISYSVNLYNKQMLEQKNVPVNK